MAAASNRIDHGRSAPSRPANPPCCSLYLGQEHAKRSARRRGRSTHPLGPWGEYHPDDPVGQDGRCMGRNLKVLHVAVGLFVAALVGSACGTQSRPLTVGVVEASAAAMDNSQTVEIESTVTQPGSTPTTTRTVYDLQHHVGEVLPTPGIDGLNGEPEVILDQSNVYLSLSGFFGGLPDVTVPVGKKWLKYTSPPNSVQANALENLFNPISPTVDMATLLNRLAPLVQSVYQQGIAMVGGVRTTRCDLTVNAKHFKSMLGADSAAPLQPSGPIQLWVDSKSRVRRLQFVFTVAHVGQMTETSDYSHFGLPVRVAIPPASEVETFRPFQKDLCSAMKTAGDSGGTQTDSGSSFTCQSKP
jgi:hypothetical protein